MALEIRRIRAAMLVAEELSFSRAASRLNVTQPALSSQVSQLEEELGFQIFNRSTRHVSLSDKGGRFLLEARRTVDEFDRLERAVKLLQRANLARTAIGTAFYTIDIASRRALLETLMNNDSETPVDISTTISQTEIARSLYAGELDMAILLGVPVEAGLYTRALSSGVDCEILYSDALQTLVLDRRKVEILVPADSSLAALPALGSADLQGQKIAMIGAFHGDQVYAPIRSYIENAGAEPVVPPEPHAIGVERFGRQFGIPAITLGWFSGAVDGSMVQKSLTDFEFHTNLVLAALPDSSTPTTGRIFEIAREMNHRVPE